jgi:hypothetical protein
MPSNPITVAVSTGATTSRAVNLDWMTGGPTTVRLTAGSGSSLAVASGHVEYTTDDILTTPSSAVGWSILSSNGLGSTAAGVLGASNFIDGNAFAFAVQSPVAGLRFSCTSFTTMGFVMEVLQGRGW